MSFGVLSGMGLGMLWGVSLGVGWGGVLVGVSLGIALWGASLAVGSVFGALRLYEYPLWLFWAWALGRLDGRGRWLRLSPPFWHEVVVLPLPGGKAQVLALARQDRQAGLAAIAYLGAYRYKWARRAASEALTQLLLDDMAAARDLRAIAEVGQRLEWLPPEAHAQWKSLLGIVEKVAGEVEAALESDTAYNRAERYRETLRLLQGWQEGLAVADASLAPRLLPILQNWQSLVQAGLEAAEKAEWLPNPYIPGSPLRTGSPVFTGRVPLFRALEEELAAYAQQRPALLLYGMRRMGKTSTLNQFPLRLGRQVVPVIVDLQALGTLTSAKDFFYLLMQRAVEQAYRTRAVELPDPAEADDPYAAFLRWLDTADAVAERENLYFLLAIDEYEKLEWALQEGRLDERLLDILRHILQHRQRWVLLLSGLLTFDLLPVRWSDRLINLRALRVGPLTPAEARDLIHFPALMARGVHYLETAEDLLIRETGGHPNWLQAALREIVRTLNRERRLEVTPEDVQEALARVPQEVRGDFDYLWRKVPWKSSAGEEEVMAYQQVLAWVAVEPGITAATLRRRLPGAGTFVRKVLHFYADRDLLIREGEGYRWSIPLLARWLRARAAEDDLLDEGKK